MNYDFERIGKEQVLKQLIEQIKGKSDYLQTTNISRIDKLKALKHLEEMAKTAHDILEELQIKSK
jgi:hypothetical protein